MTCIFQSGLLRRFDQQIQVVLNHRVLSMRELRNNKIAKTNQNLFYFLHRRKKKCIRFLRGEGDDDDSSDDEGVSTIDSTTDGDGESCQGSPAPSSTHDDGVQHPLVSQSQSSSSSHEPSQSHLEPHSDSSQSHDSAVPSKSTSSLAAPSVVPTSTILAT